MKIPKTWTIHIPDKIWMTWHYGKELFVKERTFRRLVWVNVFLTIAVIWGFFFHIGMAALAALVVLISWSLMIYSVLLFMFMTVKQQQLEEDEHV